MDALDGTSVAQSSPAPVRKYEEDVWAEGDVRRAASVRCLIGRGEQSPKKEAAMPTTRRLPLVTLGWQTWSVLAVVLAFVLLVVAYLMLG
jgi:hypothetical protein